MVRRRAITLVEIVLAMTIMLVLLGITIFFYRGEVDRAEGGVANGLVRDLATAIDRWQIESRRPWFSTRAPPGFPPDPWGHAFRIDPAKGVFWSPGEDGEDDGGAPGKDLVGRYTPWPGGGLESPRRVLVRATGPGCLTVTWDPPAKAETAIGFLVTRRTDASADWSTVATVSPTEPPSVDDLNAPAGVPCYYRVQALPGPGGGPPPTASPPVGAILPATSSPALELAADPTRLDKGGTVVLKLKGKAGGSPLQHLQAAGSTHPVAPGEFSMTLEVPAPKAGTMTLVAELYDQAGERTVRTAQIDVY